MKILMISSFLPYPLDSGGQIRLFNIIVRLAKQHEITLIAEKRENQTDADVAALKKYCKEVYTVQRKKQWSLQNICKAFFSLDSFLVVGHTLPELKTKIAEVLAKESFDCIDVETFYVMQNLPNSVIARNVMTKQSSEGLPRRSAPRNDDNEKLPIVLTEHNIEYEAYEKFILQKVPALVRPLFAWDVWKMKRAEQRTWQYATTLISLSPDEAAKMGRKDVVLVPNGVDVDRFSFTATKKKFAQKQKKILFVGTFKWMQNVSSCTYILQKIWPQLYAKCLKNGIDVSLWVVGREIPQSIRALESEGVIFDEHVDDAHEAFALSHVLLFPVSLAVGTSLKVFESMASGTPVVTSSLGTRGVKVLNGQEVLLAESEQEFIDRTYELLTQEKLYTTIAKNARAYVEEHFSWDAIVKKMDKEVFV